MFNLKSLLVNNYYSVIFFGILIFVIYFIVVFNINIHGDAKYHTLVAKESAERGYLVREQPYRIFNYYNNSRIYMPIAYPLSASSLFSIFYLFGGEIFMKLYSPIFATFIFILLFLCIREFGNFYASFISFLSTLAIGERLIMTPLMEPIIIVNLLAGCYFLKRYFINEKNSNLYLSGFMFGAASSIKQQGFLITLFVLVFVFFFLLYIYKKKKISFLNSIKTLTIFFLICLLVPSIAFKNQIDRTGTIGYSPGETGLNSSIPFSQYIQPMLSSKYKSNPAAIKSIQDTIGYNKLKLNLYEKVRGFMVSPFLYFRSSDGGYISTALMSFFFLTILLITISFLCKKTRANFISPFFIFIVGLLFIEIFNSFLFRTPITQYHSFGVLLSTSLIFLIFIKIVQVNKYLKTILVTVLIFFYSYGYLTYIYPIWNGSGREDDYHLEGYKRIGEYVQKYTPTDAIFFAAEISFRYYGKRDVVWLNESIGDLVYNVVNSTSDKTAIDNLAILKADYVVINRSQSQRRGVNDYLPPHGLISFINESPYFTKVYDPYNDGEMVVYKINYDKYF